MKSFFQTDSGKVRGHNEDSVIIVRNKDDDYLLAVADGMGGHRCGEVASYIAISYLPGRHSLPSRRNPSQARNGLRNHHLHSICAFHA